MAWTVPMTAVAGSVWTAAQYNTFVRDNLNELCPAKAQTPGGYFVTSATNQIVERTILQDVRNSPSDTTSSTSYGDLDASAGPQVTGTTGSMALIVVGGRIGPNSLAAGSVKMSWEISGASSVSASDNWAAGVVGVGTTGVGYTSRAYLQTGLTPGVNIFTAKYAVSSGTGSFLYRSILVMPF